MKKLAVLLFLLFANIAVATAQEDVKMADLMRSEGKIYVVVAVILLIFVGIAIYLIRLDWRIQKIEKEINN